MQKKVRYLIGSAGAVAPVLGLLMPTAAIAAAQAPARSGAKTVSLRLGAAASTSASPISNTGASCTGHTKVHEVFQGSGPAVPSLTTTFWYTNAIHNSAACVGTVEGTWNNYLEQTVQKFRVRVYSGTGTHKRKAFSVVKGGTMKNSHTATGAVGIRQWFGYSRSLPVEVCTAWVSSLGGATAGPQCKSVG